MPTAGDGGDQEADADDEGVPPGELRLASPYDPDARWAVKGEDLFWLGYKVHLTETCHGPAEAEAEAEDRASSGPLPNLITDVATTEATVPDVKATAPIQQRLTEHGLKPAEHYLDAGYPSADLITAARKQGITMVTPVLLDHSPQARAAEGFDKSAFAIDWKARQVRCPAGATSATWTPSASTARTRSSSSSTCAPAAPALPGTSAPPPSRTAARSPCDHKSSTTRSPTPADSSRPTTGKTSTPSGQVSKAPSTRPSTSPGYAGPATAACRKSASNTPSPPPRST